MPLTIGQLTTEVIAEADAQNTIGTNPGPAPTPDQQAIRAQLAALAHQAMRTRAEGFDD
jgi:hypothetical protein